MSLRIKLLELPEIGETLLGIGARGVALQETAVSVSLAHALASAVPGSEIIKESLDFETLHTLIGYVPDIDDDPWANSNEQLQLWERWVHDASEDYLLELFDRRHPDPRDPFMADPSPSFDQYLSTYISHEMSPAELDDALASHPMTMLTATILRQDGQDLLRQHGLDANDRNLRVLGDDLALLYGTGQQHKQAILALMAQRLPCLELEPMWMEF